MRSRQPRTNTDTYHQHTHTPPALNNVRTLSELQHAPTSCLRFDWLLEKVHVCKQLYQLYINFRQLFVASSARETLAQFGIALNTKQLEAFKKCKPLVLGR